MNKLIRRLLLFVVFITAIALPFIESNAETAKVYKVPIKDAVEKGLNEFLQDLLLKLKQLGQKQ